jgi:hypothetical protein
LRRSTLSTPALGAGEKISFDSGIWMTPRRLREAPRTGGDAQMATPQNLIAISWL